VWTVSVVVLGVLLQDKSEVACSGDQEVIRRWSRHSRRRVPIQRSAIAFARSREALGPPDCSGSQLNRANPVGP
jgi:hypothetical protein